MSSEGISLINMTAKMFHSKYINPLELEALTEQNYSDFIQELFETPNFNSHYFATNLKRCLPQMSKRFQSDVMTLLPIYVDSLSFDRNDWILLLESLSQTTSTDLENFCVIARLMSIDCELIYSILKENDVVFHLLSKDMLINAHSELFLKKQSCLSLFSAKKYSFFRMAFIEYLFRSCQIPLVIDPLYLLLKIASSIAENLSGCPQVMADSLVSVLIDMNSPPANVFSLLHLELDYLVSTTEKLISFARKMKSNDYPKDLINRIYSIILLFVPHARVFFLYKLSLKFDNDDHVLGVLISWAKKAVEEVGYNTYNWPLFILDHFTSIKSSSLLDQFDKHSHMVNFLIYLKLSKQYKKFQWNEKKTKIYAEGLKNLTKETREMIDNLGKSREVNEMGVSIPNSIIGEELQFENSESNRERVLMNVNMFEFRLDSLI